MGTTYPFLVILLVTLYNTPNANGVIYTKESVPPNEFPWPLQGNNLDYCNVIVLGAGSGGSYLATLLAQTGKLVVCVFDDGENINISSTCDDGSPYIGMCPGFQEYGAFGFPNAYYTPGLEQQALTNPNPAIDASRSISYGGLWRKVLGGDMRLSHYAIEMGMASVHRKEMYEPLGQPQEWSPEYLWGHFLDKTFKFSGPNIQGNHANQGKIRAQESNFSSSWEWTWKMACENITGNRQVFDFNTINGSEYTCSGEPSNVRESVNGKFNVRSISENEYIVPEATTNPKLHFVRDTQITRILFDKHQGQLYARGFEGAFKGRAFSAQYSSRVVTGSFAGCKIDGYDGSSDWRNNKCYSRIVMNLGTYRNPQILKLSGVGPLDELNKFGIEVVKDLPAVGNYLKEGLVSFFQFDSFSPSITAADIGLYDGNAVTSRPGAFVSTVSKGGKPYEDDMFLLWTPSNFGSIADPFIVGFFLPFQVHQPKNGSVTLITANPKDFPLVKYPFDNDDVEKQIRGLRLMCDIVREGKIGVGNETIQSYFTLFEDFGKCDGTDAEIANLVKKGAQAILHASGTTRITNGDSVHGVVDLNFDVYGIKNLKVGSMSVMPYFVAAGGQTWTLAVAFNMNNKIRGDLGLPLS